MNVVCELKLSFLNFIVYYVYVLRDSKVCINVLKKVDGVFRKGIYFCYFFQFGFLCNYIMKCVIQIFFCIQVIFVVVGIIYYE